MRPRLESLESRYLMASDWQCQPNPLDVDASGTVVALDVLLVVNDLNANGTRTLPATRPSNYTGPLCDVTGDGLLSPLDVLQIVNAINQYPDLPTLNVALTSASDSNGDQVVLANSVQYEGQTTPNSSVSVLKMEGEQSIEVARVTAGSDGKFQINLTLGAALTDLKFVAMDVRGRTVSTQREIRYGDVISSWTATMLEVVRETTNASTTIPGLLVKPPPPMVAKYLAMVHGAMFDAINAVDDKYAGYAYDPGPHASASAIAAAATAAYDVAKSIYPSPQEVARFDRTLAEIMATVPEGNAKTQGIELGHQAASAMIAARANDGSSAQVTYLQGSQPGNWNPTPPDFAGPTLPQWPGVKPFYLQSGNQFRPAAPPALSSAEYAAAVDQVMRLGSNNSTERTADQTEIARFWADGGGTSTPPGHWNQIAIDVSLRQNMSLVERARLMALINYAMADAGITSWDAKYTYDLWRPIDAIRRASEDGNAATQANPNWTPLLNTPSFPSYTSGHSTFSSAAATVLKSFFGDNFAFTTRADRGFGGQWPPSDDVGRLIKRSFSSFQAAAEEAGMSRIYGGIHYSFDNVAGQSSGSQVGQWIIDRGPKQMLS